MAFWRAVTCLGVLLGCAILQASEAKTQRAYFRDDAMPRPRMFPQEPRNGQSFKFSGVLDSRTLYQLAADIVRGREAAIEEILEGMERESTPSVSTVTGILRTAVSLLATDETPACTGCKNLLNRLKEQVDNDVPFEDIGDPLIEFCEALAPFIGVNPVICNGSVTLQGMHIYEILNRGTAYDFCEALNTCIPPRACSSEASMQSRLPLKRSRLRKRELQRPRRATRKRSRRVYNRDDVIVVAQLTDIHMQPKYAIGSAIDCGLPACCRNDYPGTGSARAWGEYSCNIPERTMRLFLEKVADINPDFILYSGDTPPHTLWDETFNSQLNCTNILVTAIHEKLPGFTVYPAIGNHELFPTNLFHPDMADTVDFNDVFTDMWSPLAGFGEEQESTMKYLGYYTKEHAPGLRILALNTILDWYNMNFYAALTGDAAFTRDYKNFVEQTLLDARTNNEKVIVIGHNPTGGSSTVVRASRWWEEMAVEYGDVIVLHVAGHTHNDHFRLFTDRETGEARHVIHVTPTANSRSTNNPSMRIFYLDKTSFQLLDYDNYMMDLDLTGNVTDIPEIVHLYQARESYGLPDMTPASWMDLTHRFIEDDELFQQWYRNYGTRTNENTCNKDCKERYLCSIWFPNYDEEEICKDQLDIDNLPTEEPGSAAGSPNQENPSSDAARVAVVSMALCCVGALVALLS